METESFQNPFISKIRVLSHLLIVSVGLNIGLFATFVYNYLKLNKEALYHLELPEISLKKEHADLLQTFFQMNFSDLVFELSNQSPISDGYQFRDLALGILSSYHYLDLEKALKGEQLEVREVMFVHTDGGEQFPLTLYPNVKEYQYDLIKSYVNESKYPFTSEGLFAQLKQKKENSPTDLALSFIHTKEFVAIYSFTSRFFEHLAKEQVVLLLLDGSYQDIERFYYLYLENVEKPKEMMRYFLKTYVGYGSKYAASLWLEIDEDYILHQLTNQEIAQLLKLTNNESFLQKVREGVRSSDVRTIAEKKLPEPQKIQEVKPVKRESYSYTVKEGDSFWKIAHRHKVSIEEIKAENNMTKDIIRPGQTLLIPKRKTKK